MLGGRKFGPTVALVIAVIILRSLKSKAPDMSFVGEDFRESEKGFMTSDDI